MKGSGEGFDPLTDQIWGCPGGFKCSWRGVLGEGVSFKVNYKGNYIGEYFADLVVEDQVMVELKCVERLANEHTAQCLNYLRASGLTVCLLVNFQRPRVEWKRVVLGFRESSSSEG
jgi:hypothetical protein